MCSGTFASLSLLCCVSFAHPVVDDCAPVRNCDTVNTWGHVVGDSPDLSIKLISSWPIIDKASQTSLMLYLSLTESNVLVHVVESISISIAVSERFVDSFNRLLLDCGVWHHLVHLLIAELHLFGSDICSVVGSWVFNMWLESVFDLLGELGNACGCFKWHLIVEKILWFLILFKNSQIQIYTMGFGVYFVGSGLGI